MNNTNTTPVVSTTQFELAHGKKPRGRGSWAFAFDVAVNGEFAEDLFWSQGTFAEARRAAVVEARRRGVTHVEVQS